MTGTVVGPAPSGARNPARRSCCTVPNEPPTLAILNDPNVLSVTIASDVASLAPTLTLPEKSIGWPKANAEFPHTAVVVPMPASVTSP